PTHSSPSTLHDALPILVGVAHGVGLACPQRGKVNVLVHRSMPPGISTGPQSTVIRLTSRSSCWSGHTTICTRVGMEPMASSGSRSEEHTSELQSRENLV